jgi:hypothetical protein
LTGCKFTYHQFIAVTNHKLFLPLKIQVHDRYSLLIVGNEEWMHFFSEERKYKESWPKGPGFGLPLKGAQSHTS